MRDLKDHAVGISLSTVISLASVVGILWVFVQPVMVAQVSDEIKDQLHKQIIDEQRPLESAFKAIIRNSINVSKRAIAQLEYRKDHDPDSWTAEHARTLADRYLEVQALEEAYREL